MSLQKLQEIKKAFEQAGWKILQEPGKLERHLFTLFDDTITWNIVNTKTNTTATVEFLAFDPLGRRTSKLNDILYCVSLKSNNKLYFKKQDADLWEKHLRTFVDSLDKP